MIKFLAVAVTVFDFVILIDGVKRDNLALMETSVCKTVHMIVSVGKTGAGDGVRLVRQFWFAVGVATF